METRDFPTADVLSVTTGRLLSNRRMDGLIELVAWITNEQPPAAPDGKFEAVWLLQGAAKARDLLIWQHPWLIDTQPPAGIGNSELLDWLLGVEGQHGDVLTLAREHPLAVLTNALDGGRQALIELAAALQQEPPEGGQQRQDGEERA